MIRSALFTICFLVGLISFCIFILWIISGFIFAFMDDEYMGVIAYAPKWIFLFSPLVFLGTRKDVQAFLFRILTKKDDVVVIIPQKKISSREIERICRVLRLGYKKDHQRKKIIFYKKGKINIFSRKQKKGGEDGNSDTDENRRSKKNQN